MRVGRMKDCGDRVPQELVVGSLVYSQRLYCFIFNLKNVFRICPRYTPELENKFSE